MPIFLFLVSGIFSLSWARADAMLADALPEPLTLEFSLSLADEPHPALELVEQQLAIAQAELAQAESLGGFNVSAQARARWIEPPASLAAYGNDDHRLQLYAKKPLLDFGRTRNSVDAAKAEIENRRWRLLDAQAQRRLQIMSNYFDVLLADIEFARDNEAMAIWFIRYDRMRERVELGQASDIDLLQANSEYQAVRKRRYAAQNAQRVTRARLAQLLNRPGQLPDKLTLPKLSHAKRKVPAVEEVLRAARERSPLLNAMRQQVQTEQAKLSAYDAEDWPQVYGEAEVAQYSREIGSADRWRAGLTVDIPLYQGGSVSGKRARQRAVLQRTQAEFDLRQRELDQALLELSLELETLYTEREERDSINRYRELYLDRARAIYEMEVKTDLGDAMVELTEAQLESARTEFKIALGWARLEALTGQSWEQVVHEK